MIGKKLHSTIVKNVLNFYSIQSQQVQIQKTRNDFEGDITIVVFSLLKYSKKTPEITANELGAYLKENINHITSYNVVKGFLNLSIDNFYWLNQFTEIYSLNDYGIVPISKDSPTFLIEFSSPNTNKPLHLGHIRNNLLGYSVSKIISASGKKVKNVQIINDKGIHICKSMLAWEMFGCGENPKDSGIKGDKLVGKYYVKFDEEYKKEVSNLIKDGFSEKEALKSAPILLKAQDMLLKWESKDPKILNLWKKMNNWVYDGFNFTYENLGVYFDKNYYESNTYLLGKDIVEIGLKKNIFYKKEDGSVWVDLTSEGLDEKLLLRSDGTTVYMTQDIGTAILRHDDFDFSNMVYTVGNEQDYHFKVLFLILNKLGFDWAKNCYHLSYGMVDLPSGKMKSREGTVVDADDLIEEMINKAKLTSKELGKLDELSLEESNLIFKKIGIGALKYYILKVDPKKRMLFDPQESIDFNGNTGPFIQYTYVRIQSLIKKYNKKAEFKNSVNLNIKEQEIIKLLLDFPLIIQDAAKEFSPSLIANYIYDLVKEFNAYYQNTPILNGEDYNQIAFRVALSDKVAQIIKTAMGLLGIEVPNKM